MSSVLLTCRAQVTAANPLIRRVSPDGLLYIADPKTSDVVALEPETGKEVWRHKPPAGLTGGDVRGLSYWGGDGAMKPRLIMIWGHNMFGLDPKSGQLSADWPATGHNIMLPPVVLLTT